MATKAVEMTFPEERGLAPGTSAIKSQALAIPVRAREIMVRSQEDLSLANAFLQDIKRLAAKITGTFDPQIAQAHSLHKSLLAQKRKFLDPLDEAERILKPKIADYLAEEDRKRLEAERARWRAEEEARRIAEKAVDRAQILDEKGEKTKADEIIEKAYSKANAILSAAPEVPEAPKVDGISLREVWKFEVVNAAAIPREYLVPDMTKIGRIVRAIKDQTSIPGIRVWSEKTVATRDSDPGMRQ